MDISYFKEFVILAETKNFWAAAERLFIGQSSLSKHIKALEQQLGAPLFERTSRRVELTAFGRLMLPYAQSISKLQYDYETAAFNYLHAESETLRIDSIPAMAQYDITDTLIRFQAAYPSVQVQTQEDDTLVIRDRLIRHECDLAFLRDSTAYLEHDPDQEAQLLRIPFCLDRLVAVFPKGHPLAAARQVELAQLKDEFFSLIKQGSMPYTLCMRACRDAGFTPRVVFTSHNLDAVLDMVTKGSCVALLFEKHVSYPADSVLTIAPPFAVVPIAPEIQTTVYLCRLKKEALSETAAHFVDYCMQTKAINSK